LTFVRFAHQSWKNKTMKSKTMNSKTVIAIQLIATATAASGCTTTFWSGDRKAASAFGWRRSHAKSFFKLLTIAAWTCGVFVSTNQNLKFACTILTRIFVNWHVFFSKWIRCLFNL